MIPVDNTVAGRVADVHHLMPHGGLHIVGEHFLRVNHQLLAFRGATLASDPPVESHVHALGQCRDFLRRHGMRVRWSWPTPPARAAEIAAAGDPTRAAIASRLAAEIYGLRDPRARTSRTPTTTPPASWSCRASRPPGPRGRRRC